MAVKSIKFSRPDRASLFGKRSEPARTLLAPATKEGLTELWRSLGFSSESEFIANLIETRVHGQGTVEKLAVERLRRASGIGQE